MQKLKERSELFKEKQQGRESREQGQERTPRDNWPDPLDLGEERLESLAELGTPVLAPQGRPRRIRDVTVEDLFEFVMKPQPGEDLGPKEILFLWMKRRAKEEHRRWRGPTPMMKERMLQDEHVPDWFPKETYRRAWNFYLTLDDSDEESHRYICEAFIGSQNIPGADSLWPQMEKVTEKMLEEDGERRRKELRSKQVSGLPPELEGTLVPRKDGDSMTDERLRRVHAEREQEATDRVRKAQVDAILREDWNRRKDVDAS